MFEQTFITSTGKRRPWTYALGLSGELLVLGLMMLLPLIYTDKLGNLEFAHLPMIAPPRGRPKPPPMMPAGTTLVRPSRPWNPDSLVYRPVTMPIDPQITIDPLDPADGPFVPFAPPDDPHNRIIGGMPDPRRAAPSPNRAKPAEVAAKAPDNKPAPLIRRGGDVQEAMIVRKVIPIYPPLARQARVQGVVKLEGVIARDGTIQQLRVISGHPLLLPAALEAVRQWVYRPTFLNGEPVEVQAPIEVRFILGQ